MVLLNTAAAFLAWATTSPESSWDSIRSVESWEIARAVWGGSGNVITEKPGPVKAIWFFPDDATAARPDGSETKERTPPPNPATRPVIARLRPAASTSRRRSLFKVRVLAAVARTRLVPPRCTKVLGIPSSGGNGISPRRFGARGSPRSSTTREGLPAAPLRMETSATSNKRNAPFTLTGRSVRTVTRLGSSPSSNTKLPTAGFPGSLPARIFR